MESSPFLSQKKNDTQKSVFDRILLKCASPLLFRVDVDKGHVQPRMKFDRTEFA